MKYMTPSLLAATCTLSLFLIYSSVHARESKWLVFTSKTGYSIEYPREWHKIFMGDNGLEIASTNDLLKAVIIPRRAQMILVEEVADSSSERFLSRLQRENPDDKIVKRFRRKFRDNKGQYCDVAAVVENLDEVGPNTFYVEDNIVCEISGRTFNLRLTQWKADPYSAAAFEIAMSMMSSLHL